MTSFAADGCCRVYCRCAILERLLPLQEHTVPDEQTGALGDVEIVLVADNQVITAYEMKDRVMARNDVDQGIAEGAKILAKGR